jgi:prevent-host-death family protein
MTTIAADQAKSEFEALLSRAAQGEEFTITDHGTPVAKLVPARPAATPKFPMTLEELREWRKGNILGPDLTIKQLIEEGRKH